MQPRMMVTRAVVSFTRLQASSSVCSKSLPFAPRCLRIAQLCHEYPPHTGGLEVIVREVSERLAARHDVVVVTAAVGEATGVEHRGRLTIHRLPSIRPIERFGVPYTVPTGPLLRDACAAVASCDVVHVHGSIYAQSLIGARLARARKAPLFITEHVGWVPYASVMLRAVQSVAWRSVGQVVLSGATGAITYNQRVMDWMQLQRPALPVESITNGVDLEQYRPADAAERRGLRDKLGLPSNQVLALTVGRDVPKKQLGALRSWARRSHTLVTCGSALPSGEGVHALGEVPGARMPDVYRACDFLVHAGVGEGFPLAVQEAMACGLPPAILWDEAYAAAVRPDAVVPASSLDELQRAAELLATDASARDASGARARAYAAAEWSWDRTVDRYEAAYVRAGVVRT